jgi:hypothetical protein
MCDCYNGSEQVHTASGQGMAIQHIGHASFHTPDCPIHLNHVHGATKSLVSAFKLVSDNNSYVEIHQKFFAIKDQASGKTLLQRASRNVLYPLNAMSSSEKQVISTSTPSSARWHARLGHPSFSVAQQILSSIKFRFQVNMMSQFMMHVRRAKVINCLILGLLVCLLLYWSYISQMFGARLLFLLVATNIM